MARDDSVSTDSFDWRKLLNVEFWDSGFDAVSVASMTTPTTRPGTAEHSTNALAPATVSTDGRLATKERCSSCRETWDLTGLNVVDHAALSWALSQLAAENEQLKQRVRELEDRLATVQAEKSSATSAGVCRGKKGTLSDVANTNGASSSGQRMVIGFAYLTKSLVRELASFLTISNGQVGWTDSPCTASSASSDHEAAEADEPSSPRADSEAASKTSTCTFEGHATTKRKPNTSWMLEKHVQIGPSKRTRHEKTTNKAYRSAARYAANGAIFSIFFFFSLALLPPILDVLGLLTGTAPATHHVLSLPPA
ncbi:hypothetical protein F1559_002633 [Cyanidiococcus yangmingshanensis]|uniref:Uncharacterized protein n=1 Tax=Cyanidiococcus yangmingshanensis TaxID=2690220 RepID=A0A7J7IP07_9RHOD|nr:hypothetical protein F1559_002633 [Cyanidiococcus yangmingshanensis]